MDGYQLALGTAQCSSLTGVQSSILVDFWLSPWLPNAYARTRADFTMLLVRVKYDSVWILLENHHHIGTKLYTPILRYYASQEENSELVFLFCQIDADADGYSKLELIRW
jgi:hypothetical protein